MELDKILKNITWQSNVNTPFPLTKMKNKDSKNVKITQISHVKSFRSTALAPR